MSSDACGDNTDHSRVWRVRRERSNQRFATAGVTPPHVAQVPAVLTRRQQRCESESICH